MENCLRRYLSNECSCAFRKASETNYKGSGRLHGDDELSKSLATQVPTILGQAQTGGAAQAQPTQASPQQVLLEASRRSSLIAYGGKRDTDGATSYAQPADNGEGGLSGRNTAHEPTNLENLRRASVIGQAQAHPLPDRNFLVTAGTFIPCVLQSAMDSASPGSSPASFRATSIRTTVASC
jgi:type IV secretory pathway VirB10-like protein